MSPDFGKRRYSHDDLWKIFLPYTTFFWVKNVSMAKIVACRSYSVAVISNNQHMWLETTSSRKKGLF